MEITKKLRKKLRSEWLKALESGKYRQTKGVLLKKDKSGHRSFCCLGVACDIYKKVVDKDFDLTPIQDEGTLDVAEAVQEAFGFRSDEGEFYDSINGFNSLATCNDGNEDEGEKSNKLNFKQIAKLVRKHSKLVFKD